MTSEIYLTPTGHAEDCDWHVDQYPWECTCGFIPRKKAMDNLIAQDADLIDAPLVEQLRTYTCLHGNRHVVCEKAADRIEALEAEIERLRQHLASLEAALIRDMGAGYAGVALIRAALAGDSHV